MAWAKGGCRVVGSHLRKHGKEIRRYIHFFSGILFLVHLWRCVYNLNFWKLHVSLPRFSPRLASKRHLLAFQLISRGSFHIVKDQFIWFNRDGKISMLFCWAFLSPLYSRDWPGTERSIQCKPYSRDDLHVWQLKGYWSQDVFNWLTRPGLYIFARWVEFNWKWLTYNRKNFIDTWSLCHEIMSQIRSAD